MPLKSTRFIVVIVIVLCCTIKFCAAQNGAGQLFRQFADSNQTASSDGFFIIEWKNEKPDFFVARQLNNSTAIVWAGHHSLQKTSNIVRYSPANNYWKLSPAVSTIPSKAGQEFLLSGPDLKSLINALNSLEKQLTILEIYSNAVKIKTIADDVVSNFIVLKELTFIDIPVKPITEIGIIGYNRSFHGINMFDAFLPAANGKGITAGVKEQNMEVADLDLYKRVLPSPIASGTTSMHATVIASIIGGAGNSFYDGRGVAPGCRFLSSSFDQLFPDDIQLLNTNKVSVQNHSYGTVIQQFYGAEAAAYDAQVWNNKIIAHVFSAGNRGADASTTGPYASIAGFANLTGNFKMSKNNITVGAVDNNENIAAQSSAGPMYDGRLAPQITALGPNGTSDAAAMVSGTIAVMQQVYADSNAQQLPAVSLTKAILFNTAKDIYTRGIDFKTGYGLLDSYEAVKAMQQKNFDGGSVTQGQVWTKLINVMANAANIKLTLAWTDTTSLLNNNKALVNDLDLELREINTGLIYKPWVLNSAAHADSLKKAPVRKRDSLNTTEQISIEMPAAGNYEIAVKGTTIAASPVAFHLAFKTDTLNTFHFTNPLHSADVNRDENEMLLIQWKTWVADTNQTGNLKISYDAGVSWQTIAQGYRIYQNKYRWLIKDTSSRAWLKMETAFGDFFSRQFMLAKPTRPIVDFNCTDSLRLSWNKHTDAIAYKIFALADSAYLKQVATSSDSFIVMDKTVFPQQVFAIEPVLSNGIEAARSVAIDVNFQGVQCFYRTFYHTMEDSNKINLVLELSSPAYVDSIYFEQVNESGEYLKTVGAQKVFNAFVYEQLVSGLAAGTSFWRVRLKMKNDARIFTHPIEVLSSGNQFILFYPNPVPRGSSVNRILQQGTGTNAKLAFYDVAGRLLQSFSSIPDRLNFSSLPPGIIIFRLLSNKNELLQTGKLLLQ